MPRSFKVELNKSRKAFNSCPIGLFLIISDLGRLSMATRREVRYVKVADATDG